MTVLRRIQTDIHINVQPSRVWRIIEKHLQNPEASSLQEDPSGIRAVHGEPLTQQRSGVGTGTRWFYEYKGRPFVWDDVVTEWEPQEKVVWKATSAWEMVDSFRLEREENGTRVVVFHYEIRP